MVEEKHFKNNKERFEQLELCKFTDELGHSLENNVGYIELKKIHSSPVNLKKLAQTGGKPDLEMTELMMKNPSYGRIWTLAQEELIKRRFS